MAETALSPSHLVFPLFIREGRGPRTEIGSMPGIYQLTLKDLAAEAERAVSAGVPAVLLFGIPARKDAKASGAYAKDGIVQKSTRLLKKEFPQLLVITDVCLCEYMAHGHCGIVSQRGGAARIENDSSLKLLAQTALSHAEAGADMVAPSDMMDGRVAAIRTLLDQRGFDHTPIMAYSAKFASAYYGPFREAAESTPKFGDRRSYQMDASNPREALREVALDIQEGADIVMVKPALAYLDIIHAVKSTFSYPVAAYNVSAEYSMVKAAAQRGWIDERAIVLETLLAMRRAGADILITYSAVDAAKWITEI